MQSSEHIKQEKNLPVDFVALARNAAAGDNRARKTVNELAHPMIAYQTNRFCKRFCAENKYNYRCSLESPWGNAPSDALLCEWGNASYGWMLNDLTSEQRLTRFQGTHGARLQDYIYRIANSLPFYERWKDWRFGRRIRVPDYIKDIDPNAAKVYLAMRSEDHSELIAQKTGLSLEAVENIAQKIIIVLTRKHRLHLLNPDREFSLAESSPDDASTSAESGEKDIAVFDPDPEDAQRAITLHSAWQELSPVEQFIIEAMVIEEQDANDVLTAIKKLDIQINAKVSVQDTDRQQLYYFRRKTLAKLADLIGDL